MADEHYHKHSILYSTPRPVTEEEIERAHQAIEDAIKTVWPEATMHGVISTPRLPTRLICAQCGQTKHEGRCAYLTRPLHDFYTT